MIGQSFFFQIVFAAALAYASAGVAVLQPTVLAHSAPLVPVLKTGPVVAIQPAPVVPIIKSAPVIVAHAAPVVPVVKAAPVITKTIQSQSIVHPSPVLIH